MTVVLTGGPFPLEHPAAALMREPRLGSRVLHLGYRSPLEVRALFQDCVALVFPSLFEGFGMPVAEAIIAGKPVACSNVTSLPEIGGDAAVMFDPLDVQEMAARILDIATDAELRASLAAAARRRRAVFSASLSAIKTLAVYETAMA
jgi:glycosyltransferase involved in cell wall biosynthesis